MRKELSAVGILAATIGWILFCFCWPLEGQQQNIRRASGGIGATNNINSSAALAAAIGDGTGTPGSAVFANAPTISNPTFNGGFTTAGNFTSGNATVCAGCGLFWNTKALLLSPADGQIQIENSGFNNFDRLILGPSAFPAIVVSNGVPSVAAPVGSLYLRKDGGATSTLYVKESGTGTSGWVAK